MHSLVQHGHNIIHVCACSGVREICAYRPPRPHICYTPLRTWNSAPTPTVHAPLPHVPPCRGLRLPKSQTAGRRAEAQAAYGNCCAVFGVFPARRRSRDCGIMSTAWGCAALELALVGYAGSAQHEVTRLQRRDFNGAGCPSFDITVKTKQNYIFISHSTF